MVDLVLFSKRLSVISDTDDQSLIQDVLFSQLIDRLAKIIIHEGDLSVIGPVGEFLLKGRRRIIREVGIEMVNPA